MPDRIPGALFHLGVPLALAVGGGPPRFEQIATLTRTLYTSGTTLLPLLALVFFGGATLYWFGIALALGVVVGSWSSIALAPSMLTLWDRSRD